MFRSIRSRLSLSFASIALVAAIALGVVLLVILQKYYLNQEIDYLRGNAQAVSKVVTTMISSNAPHDEIQSQVESLAFLTQTRIQVYGSDTKLLYDSGTPQNVNINLTTEKQLFIEGKETLPAGTLPMISIIQQGVSQSSIAPSPGTSQTVHAIPDSSNSVQGPKSVVIYRSVRVSGSPFGFYLNAEAIPVSAARSNLKITELIRDPQSTDKLDSVVLSEGPAYGTAILKNVALGWALASAIAVLLAAGIGWYISRRISAPVLALTDVTGRMARGDLSSRADVKSRDELGQLGLSFNEMADQVETTVAALRSFVSDAAHELRTPLTALRTNLDLALDEKDTTDRTAFIVRAQAMVQRLEELNANLLDLSRLEASGLVTKKTVVNLTELLRSRIEAYASQAEQAGLTFKEELPTMPVYVRADANQIRRAMDNLVDNACKFTPQEGTMRIVLSQQGEQTIFSVTDTGIGIPGDDLSQILNRFHRGRNTAAYPGSGLGLAIVRAIATANAGSVEVQSAGEGQGSQFSIRMPVVSSPDA
jgi:signal transduction histidine kinase